LIVSDNPTISASLSGSRSRWLAIDPTISQHIFRQKEPTMTEDDYWFIALMIVLMVVGFLADRETIRRSIGGQLVKWRWRRAVAQGIKQRLLPKRPRPS
jgi:hypothetical protein